MNRVLLTIMILYTVKIVYSQQNDIEDFLWETPDIISYNEISTKDTLRKTYELKIKQPLEHSDTSKGFFSQRVFLSYTNPAKPVVLLADGYMIEKYFIDEITTLTEGNQIYVEHRFYGKSKPDSLNYSYLNSKQSSADLHKIRKLFNPIYSNKWISTGGSKGGETVIYYKYLYPNDIDVCIPLFAPILNEFHDKRVSHFLDTIGTEECRNKIRYFQLRLLKNKEKVISMIKNYDFEEAIFTIVPVEKVFLYSVLEYPVLFWQYGEVQCDEIPTRKTSLEEAVCHFIKVSEMDWYADNNLIELRPYYYQVATEIGTSADYLDGLEKYIEQETDTLEFYRMVLPKNVDLTFNKEFRDNILEWLKTEGDHFIYVYGSNDPYTAAKIPFSDKVDSEWFILNGKNHATAYYSQMTPNEKKRFISILEDWLAIEIECDIE